MFWKTLATLPVLRFFLEHGTGKRRVQWSLWSLYIRNIREASDLFIEHTSRDSDECENEVRRNAKKAELAKDAAQASASETQQSHLQLQPQVSGRQRHFLLSLKMAHWNSDVVSSTMADYTIASTSTISNASTPNLTPRQSHINFHHLPSLWMVWMGRMLDTAAYSDDPKACQNHVQLRISLSKYGIVKGIWSQRKLTMH